MHSTTCKACVGSSLAWLTHFFLPGQIIFDICKECPLLWMHFEILTSEILKAWSQNVYVSVDDTYLTVTFKIFHVLLLTCIVCS